MKKIYSFLVTVAAFALTNGANAQAVTFTDQGAALQNIGGFSYADCAVDMNGDHLDDVVRVDGSTIYIDYQQTDGTFIPAEFNIGITNVPSWSICAADIDDNGYTDLLFGDGSALSFIYANDDGTAYYEDVQGEYIFTQRSTFCDIDNDGNLDAFACHDVDQCRPYRNTAGILTYDASLIETLDIGGNYAAIWVDYDNDWDADLYITKCRGGAPVGDPQRINLLYRNDLNFNGEFTSVGPEANMDDGDQSWATNFEDWDNDGDFDSFTVNHEWANRLMENNGDGTFTDAIAGSGIDESDLGAWNCDAGDFNNDGFVDIFSEMSKEIYWNNGDWTFTAGDLPMNSGGIGDMNSDGFLDVIAGNSLWLNDGNDNNYVKFDLEGIISNKDGIGARIEIFGSWGIQIREVRAGESFDPASSLIAHFGLGTADEITQAIIKWPSGLVSVLDYPEINTTHVVDEVGCMLDPNTVTVNGELQFCPGESVILTAADGYDYNWSNGENSQSITVSTGGAYSVIIWDEEGCVSVSNLVVVSIIEDETPVITLVGEETFCQGGTAVLSSSIGDNYQWSNGMTGQTIVVTESGTYHVNIDGTCTGIELESDPITITVMAAPAPVADDVAIGEPGTATLTATGNNLNWYATETSTEVLGTGNTFETAFFDLQVSYWVDATTIYGGEFQTGGKEDNSGSGGLPSSGGDLFFNADEFFHLISVKVYIPEGGVTGIRTVQLFDGDGQLVNEAAFDLTTIGEHVLPLAWDVQPGAGYAISQVENNLFRNNGGVSYPYPIGTAGSIYTSTNGAGSYYYFYDWQIQTETVPCTSERVEVMATVVGISETENPFGLSLYPNPAADVLNIKCRIPAHAATTLTVCDVLGEVVHTQQLQPQGNMVLNIEKFAPGIYSLTLQSAGIKATQEFVIK